jgi:ferritin-like metal-binding protein YciE
MPGQSKTLEDLFEENLKDIYYAERKILVAPAQDGQGGEVE